eukprot:GHVH01004896.1.p1 GENE.GHVH01004896.1~~GHVH01004896.1.p1  ORF type:complete len:1053 (+),score=144.09 GHVH01004896.1:37-3159(+)
MEDADPPNWVQGRKLGTGTEDFFQLRQRASNDEFHKKLLPLLPVPVHSKRRSSEVLSTYHSVVKKTLRSASERESDVQHTTSTSVGLDDEAVKMLDHCLGGPRPDEPPCVVQREEKAIMWIKPSGYIPVDVLGVDDGGGELSNPRWVAEYPAVVHPRTLVPQVDLLVTSRPLVVHPVDASSQEEDVAPDRAPRMAFDGPVFFIPRDPHDITAPLYHGEPACLHQEGASLYGKLPARIPLDDLRDSSLGLDVLNGYLLEGPIDPVEPACSPVPLRLDHRVQEPSEAPVALRGLEFPFERLPISYDPCVLGNRGGLMEIIRQEFKHDASGDVFDLPMKSNLWASKGLQAVSKFTDTFSMVKTERWRARPVVDGSGECHASLMDLLEDHEVSAVHPPRADGWEMRIDVSSVDDSEGASTESADSPPLASSPHSSDLSPTTSLALMALREMNASEALGTSHVADPTVSFASWIHTMLGPAEHQVETEDPWSSVSDHFDELLHEWTDSRPSGVDAQGRALATWVRLRLVDLLLHESILSAMGLSVEILSASSSDCVDDLKDDEYKLLMRFYSIITAPMKGLLTEFYNRCSDVVGVGSLELSRIELWEHPYLSKSRVPQGSLFYALGSLSADIAPEGLCSFPYYEFCTSITQEFKQRRLIVTDNEMMAVTVESILSARCDPNVHFIASHDIMIDFDAVVSRCKLSGGTIILSNPSFHSLNQKRERRAWLMDLMSDDTTIIWMPSHRVFVDPYHALRIIGILDPCDGPVSRILPAPDRGSLAPWKGRSHAGRCSRVSVVSPHKSVIVCESIYREILNLISSDPSRVERLTRTASVWPSEWMAEDEGASVGPLPLLGADWSNKVVMWTNSKRFFLHEIKLEVHRIDECKCTCINNILKSQCPSSRLEILNDDFMRLTISEDALRVCSSVDNVLVGLLPSDACSYCISHAVASVGGMPWRNHNFGHVFASDLGPCYHAVFIISHICQLFDIFERFCNGLKPLSDLVIDYLQDQRISSKFVEEYQARLASCPECTCSIGSIQVFQLRDLV